MAEKEFNLENLFKTHWKRIVIVGALLIVLLLQFSVISQLIHIPGPVYGGDLYREKGFSLHIQNGNPFWTDPYMKGEYKFYPPLGYLLSAGLSTLLSVDIEKVLLYLPLFVTFLIYFAAFILGKVIFNDEAYAFLLAISAITLEIFVHFKHTHGIGYAFAILALACFVQIRKNPSRKINILGGLLLGLTALSHYQPLLYVISIVIAFVIFDSLYCFKKGESLKSIAIRTLRDYWLMALIGIAIAMLFFGPLIFHYHMKTLNLTNQYSLFNPDTHGISWVFSLFWGSFFGFANFRHFVYTFICLLGFIHCILNFKKIECRFSLFAFFGLILASGHYLITKPLFNNWVVPSHISSGQILTKIILLVFGVRFIVASFKKIKHIKLYGFLIVITLIILPLYSHLYAIAQNEDRWIDYGRQMDENTQLLFDIGDWLRFTATEDDVFLGNDESSFMINAMSGRKLVTVRRTHASPYVDLDEHYADAFVMLYGNNPKVIKNLITKYGVTYLYFDQFLVQYPMLTHPRFSNYLQENGVTYEVQRVRLDPSTPDAPMYDYLVIPPQNLTSIQLFYPEKQFVMQGQVYSAFFRVNETALELID